MPAAVRCQPIPHTLWFHPLNGEHGLVQSYNWYVFHDSQGFVWVSSLSGLNRYDGARVKQYFSIPADSTSLLDENVYSQFFEDSRTDIWFTTSEGIHCYRRLSDNFSRYVMYAPDGSKIPINYKAYFLEKDSFLWVGNEQAMYRFNIYRPDDRLRPVAEIKKFDCRFQVGPDGYVTKIFAFNNRDNGLEIHFIDKGKWRKSTTALKDCLIRDVAPAVGRGAWVVTDKYGLFFRTGSGSMEPINPDLGKFPVSLAPWGADRLVAVERGGGVFVIKNRETFPVACQFLGKDQDAVQGFKNAYVDKEENLWISDRTGGLHYASLRKTKFRSLPKLPVNGTNTNYSYWKLTEGPGKEVWVGSSYGGIFRLDKEGRLIRRYESRRKDPSSLPATSVYDLVWDKKEKRMWVATSGGLGWIDPSSGRFHLISTDSGETDFHFINLLQTKKDGRILAVTESTGIFTIKKVRGRERLVKIRSDSTGQYQLIFEGNDGRLYCSRNSTEICVFSFRNDRLIQIDTLPVSGLVNGFHEDPVNGNLFFATSYGLVKLNPRIADFKPVIYTEEQGLPGKFIGAMEADRKGNLWLGTNKGLAVFRADTVIAFRRADGMRSIEFNIAAALIKESSGEVWLGGSNGITIVPPNWHSFGIHRRPRIALTGILINDAAGENLICDSSGATNVSRITHLVRPYSDNTVSLDFVAMEYSDPANTQLKYKLDGLDGDQWVTLEKGKAGFARYSKLNPGTYSFIVMAANSDGVWHEETIPLLTLTIIPPWYMTWWAKALGVLIFFGIVYAFYRYRIGQIKKKEEMLRREAELRQRAAEARQQAAETETAILRLQMNPHFIFNCLNSINDYILKKDIDTASDYLGRFAQLMRMILKFSAKPYIPISTEINLLELYMQTEAMRFENKFSYEFEIDDALDPDDVIIPTMILQPFVENAVWHGLSGKQAGKIVVGFKKNKEYLLCSVSDNGIGIQASLENKDRTGTHESKALSITQRRLDLIPRENGVGASCEIRDLKNQEGQSRGTQVLVHLPFL